MAQPKSDFQPGATVGQYTITRRIGTGGMGEVYEALHVGLDKKFAIKTLRREHAEHETIVARFLREGQVASRIHHPNIVNVTDVGVIGIPDELWGQRVVAYIPADQMSLGIEELRARLSPHLLPAELPRELRAWPGPLPRTPGGKLRRAVLRADSQAVR